MASLKDGDWLAWPTSADQLRVPVLSPLLCCDSRPVSLNLGSPMVGIRACAGVGVAGCAAEAAGEKSSSLRTEGEKGVMSSKLPVKDRSSVE